MNGAELQWEQDGPARLYVITKGRSGPPEQAPWDLVTLVVACTAAQPGMPPEHAAILRLCQSPLSVAEVSAYLRLPVSVVTVLLADLVGASRIVTRAPIPRAPSPDVALLEAVLHGLQKL
ncbi:DUF742 domain-containing protein [Streptomyces antimycoticus]|uniref:DUF742 domain-containing protein n=1 Tax=Streptomyces antimycoticus TaxID=68175 RepID=UPI00343DA756